MGDLQNLVEKIIHCEKDKCKQKAIIEDIIREDVAMLSAAESIFSTFCQDSLRSFDSSFLNKFIAAWAEFTINGLSNISSIKPFTHVDNICLKHSKHTLFITWHFPAYPLIVPHILEQNIVAVVAQNSSWFRLLTDSGLSANFRTKQGLSFLARALKIKKSLLMMFDYCYEGTRNRVVNFLDRPCKTPSGLLELAIRYNYSISFVSMVGNQISATPVLYNGVDVEAFMLEINNMIAIEILKNPPQWLLWGSLNSRSVF